MRLVCLLRAFPAVAVLLVAASGAAFVDSQANLAEPATASKAAAPAYENDRGSWVFVPIPVANPTFGNGLQLRALYLHPPSSDGPPATSGVGAMVTDNGTRLVAAFHDQSLMQDRFRLTAIVAGGQLQAQFFGIGAGSAFANHPIGSRNAEGCWRSSTPVGPPRRRANSAAQRAS